jgi:pimeloyl-ACP methyl ester carboxylesterase
MGSELWKDGKLIWPGSASELLLPYAHMDALLDPTTKVGDIIRKVSISTQYGALVDALNACGFVEGGLTPTLKVFPYDWRKDNAQAASQLADVVDTVAATLGADPDITVVAHSMGGLVSRNYLESGMYNTRPGIGAVKRLITLATPHRGAPMALSAALGNERRLFLNAAQVRQVANDTNFPSLYQLLPPADEGFVWDRSDNQRFNPLDIYAPDIATKLGLSKANLDAAARFHATLSLARRPPKVRYFFFAGTHETTTTSAQVRVNEPKPANRFRKVDRPRGGDGTVPVWSALMTGVQSEQVGGEHGGIYKNRDLLSVLGVLLDKPGILAAAGDIPEVWVRHPVIEPDADVELTLELPRGVDTVDGELRVVRRRDADSTTVRMMPMKYSGPIIDHLALIFPAPDIAGAYELTFTSAAWATPASTELFVQSP